MIPKIFRSGPSIYTLESNKDKISLPGYQDIKPMVFSGVFPVNTEDYEDLKESLEKLHLIDSSLFYQPESSSALGLRLSVKQINGFCDMSLTLFSRAILFIFLSTNRLLNGSGGISGLCGSMKWINK